MGEGGNTRGRIPDIEGFGAGGGEDAHGKGKEGEKGKTHRSYLTSGRPFATRPRLGLVAMKNPKLLAILLVVIVGEYLAMRWTAQLVLAGDGPPAGTPA